MTIPPQKVVSRDLDRAANPGTGARPAKKITNRFLNSTKHLNSTKYVYAKKTGKFSISLIKQNM